MKATADNARSIVISANNTNALSSHAQDAITMGAPGGMRIYTDVTNNAYAVLDAASGLWNIISDRNLKENFEEINEVDILHRLVALPITKWNYKRSPGLKYIGPVVQDWKSTFDIGHLDEESEHYLSFTSLEVQGIALASIKGLYKLYEESQEEFETTKATLDATIDELAQTNIVLDETAEQLLATQAKVDELEARLQALEEILLAHIGA